MCGIVAIIDTAKRPLPALLVRTMTDQIAHRGPDDEGYVLIDEERDAHGAFAGRDSASELRGSLAPLGTDPALSGANIALAHRRFSIVDLSVAAHQPFFDAARTCCVVFNGEIYNYVEVREELVAQGVRFHTHSDTEVLLEAYKHWGTECFTRLNGFWAIVLYDFRRRRLLVSRDRVGKKPLFWTRVGTTVYFASEIKSLLGVSAVRERQRVNVNAAYQWLAYGRKDLGCETMYEEINSFPAGSWAEVTARFPETTARYWEVPRHRQTERQIGVEEAARTVRELLVDAVRLRLRADVPVSVELSGGLDSSTLVALASQASAKRITTYTVRFPEKEWNEEPFARAVAERYGADYRVLESPVANFWAHIRAFTHLEEEPYHAPNLQTNQVIWSQMRAHGTKVSLNGAAGDELFAGYEYYYGPAQAENLLKGRLTAYARNARAHTESDSLREAWLGPVVGLTRAFLNRTAGRALASFRRPPAYIRGMSWRPSVAGVATLSGKLRSDMTNTLIPYWLNSGDRGSMGIPVEVRAPFLDYRVIDYVSSLPTTYLIRDGWHKWILRKAMDNLLPQSVVWRRQKLGFPFPFERFYSDNAEILDLIFDRADNPFVDTSKRAMFRSDWRVISFLLWYEMFFNQNTALFEDIQALAQRSAAADEWGHQPEYLTSCA